MIENTIPILRVADVARSVDYYRRTLGFEQDWSTGDFASISRDGCCIYLTQSDQSPPGAWLWMGVEDIDAMFEACVASGADLVSEMLSYPWAREFRVRDLDGNVVRVGGEADSTSSD